MTIFNPVIFKQLLTQSDASGSRSTVLKPLSWLIGVLFGGLGMIVYLNAPIWMLIFTSILIGLCILVFFFAFIFCLFKDRDALRSEKYSIQKLAIEKGVVGDNLNGFFLEDRTQYSERTATTVEDTTSEAK